MKNQTQHNIDETSTSFVKFLRANKMQSAGVDFKTRQINYKFTDPKHEKNIEERFTIDDLSMAYTYFIEGYNGKPNKQEGGFGQAQQSIKSDHTQITDEEALIVHESTLRGFLATNNETYKDARQSLEERGEFSIEHTQGALILAQENLYNVEHYLGRGANTLNE